MAVEYCHISLTGVNDLGSAIQDPSVVMQSILEHNC
jgi:hypothetical protein